MKKSRGCDQDHNKVPQPWPTNYGRTSTQRLLQQSNRLVRFRWQARQLLRQELLALPCTSGRLSRSTWRDRMPDPLCHQAGSWEMLESQIALAAFRGTPDDHEPCRSNC